MCGSEIRRDSWAESSGRVSGTGGICRSDFSGRAVYSNSPFCPIGFQVASRKAKRDKIGMGSRMGQAWGERDLSIPPPSLTFSMELPSAMLFLRTSCLITLMLTQCALIPGSRSFAQDVVTEADRVRRLVSKLGHSSYATRQAAKSHLLGLAVQSEQHASMVLGALRQDRLDPDDLEIQLSARSLRDVIETRVRNRLIDQFLNDPEFDEGLMVGWQPFKRIAGPDPSAKRVFAKAIERDSNFGTKLLQVSSSKSVLAFDAVFPQQPLAQRDTVGWIMALVQQCYRQHHLVDESELRLISSLRSFGTGPSWSDTPDAVVLRRVVGSFLKVSRADVGDLIVIAVRFQMAQQAERLCRSVLVDPSQSPSRLVTALLAASIVNPSSEDVDDWIQRYRHDTRTSHVWRSLTPPKTLRRTQIRDVALAIHFHRAGLDPRERGFDALEADPILVFRPYSLGFLSDRDRMVAHANGWD